MKDHRLGEYLDHMRAAAADACCFVAGMSKEGFEGDKRTQQAVIMSLIIVGEAATRIATDHPEFTEAHPHVPWRNMRGMRNRIAHGYFETNLDIVWDTVTTSLPQLLDQLAKLPGNAPSTCASGN